MSARKGEGEKGIRMPRREEGGERFGEIVERPTRLRDERGGNAGGEIEV